MSSLYRTFADRLCDVIYERSHRFAGFPGEIFQSNDVVKSRPYPFLAEESSRDRPPVSNKDFFRYRVYPTGPVTCDRKIMFFGSASEESILDILRETVLPSNSWSPSDKMSIALISSVFVRYFKAFDCLKSASKKMASFGLFFALDRLILSPVRREDEMHLFPFQLFFPLGSIRALLKVQFPGYPGPPVRKVHRLFRFLHPRGDCHTAVFTRPFFKLGNSIFA